MEWFKNYEEDLKEAFAEARRRILAWPPSFQGQALQYMEGFDITKREVPTNYICFLLPYWMESAAGQDRNLSRHICLAHLFGMMAYHLQDEAMDKPDAQLLRVLPLSALLQREFQELYSDIFPAESNFWQYHSRYLFQWAEAVSREQEQDWFHQDPVKLGHKASLVKLAGTGLLLHGGRPELIPELEQALDQTLVLLQMLDDWEDWEKDLIEGSYNSLVAVARLKLKLPEDQPVTPDGMREALFTLGALTDFADRAEAWEPEISGIKTIVPELYTFYRFLLENLRTGAARIEQQKMLLQSGGLQYLLSKMAVKNG